MNNHRRLKSFDQFYDVLAIPGDPSIATSRSNLALVLKDLEELEGARDLARKAYERFLQKSGHDHGGNLVARATWKSMQFLLAGESDDALTVKKNSIRK